MKVKEVIDFVNNNHFELIYEATTKLKKKDSTIKTIKKDEEVHSFCYYIANTTILQLEDGLVAITEIMKLEESDGQMHFDAPCTLDAYEVKETNYKSYQVKYPEEPEDYWSNEE